jgi:hypothetical protein
MLTGINPSLCDTLSDDQKSALTMACAPLKSLPIRILYTRSLADIHRHIEKKESKLYVVDQIQPVNCLGNRFEGEVLCFRRNETLCCFFSRDILRLLSLFFIPHIIHLSAC